MSNIKALKTLSLTILCLSVLTSCSSADKLIFIEKRPDYGATQKADEEATKKPLLGNILDTEDQEKDQTSVSSIIPSENSTSSYETLTKSQQEEISGRRTVKVSKVIDSDTIEYFDPQVGSNVTARLIGINGPEYTKEKQLYGKEATEFLTHLILGQEIQIESDPNANTTDRYGRYLIHAFIGGRSIQSILIKEGLVRVAYLYDKYKYIDSFQEAEAVAKKSGLNIWSIPGYVDNKNGFNMEIINGGHFETFKQETKKIFKNITEILIKNADK